MTTRFSVLGVRPVTGARLIQRTMQCSPRSVACRGVVTGLALMLGSAIEASTIGPFFNPGNGHRYYVFDDMVTWADGEALATGLGGHLATINDAAENQWILTSLASSGNTYWIGLRDDVTEGVFEWNTGEPVNYTNWATGEPDDDAGIGGNGDFGYVNGLDGTWGDTNGFFTGFVTGGIIEVELASQCDMNGDGDFNTGDLLLLQRYLLGI